MPTYIYTIKPKPKLETKLVEADKTGWNHL